MRRPSTRGELQGAYLSRMQIPYEAEVLPDSVLTCVQVVIAPYGLIVPESAFQKRLKYEQVGGGQGWKAD